MAEFTPLEHDVRMDLAMVYARRGDVATYADGLAAVDRFTKGLRPDKSNPAYVEAVARALCTVDGHDPDEVRLHQPSTGWIYRRWEEYRDAARAGVAAMADVEGRPPSPTFDLIAHLRRQSAWSERTLGPGAHVAGIVKHIVKELEEIEAAPRDLIEWMDVVLLAFDGAWRSGATPEQIAEALASKHAENEARQWPDWRTVPDGEAIEHIRDAEEVRRA